MNGHEAEFDAFVDSYDEELRRALAVSGEGPEFYAEHRVAFLERCLRGLGHQVGSVLDFGCGLGRTASHLARILGATNVVGVDESVESVKRATQEMGTLGRFLPLTMLGPEAVFDLAYCNGVFHHIPPARRAEALLYVHQRLRPGGIFAIWENNPWNPVVSLLMNRSFIDRNAVKVPPTKALKLGREVGFQFLRIDFLFFFPRAVAPLRVLDPLLRKLPLGAQYQTLWRKPA